ncbi:MAG: fatty acid desaturase [Candidatus Caenarcaniphilales bacterium]|nr:fatty acid desaturase [Candidatus Caenarcaniphilales bacterium]
MQSASFVYELSDKEKISRITALIRHAEKRLRSKFPILNEQNLIGAFILVYSCAAFIINSLLYIQGIIPAWLCFILNAFCTSFLHEMEHDLIHHIYFRTKPIVQNLFMFVIWVFRGNLISPWYRRMIHLIHHRESGQVTDIEERLIGNGMFYGLKRFITMFDTALGWINFKELKEQIPSFKLSAILKATFPIFIIFNMIWFSFIAQQGWKIISVIHSVIPPFPTWYVELVSILMVIYVGPNMLRQASLSLVSSTCHYYGDIKKGDLLRQVQILQPWFLIPFQLFCFNFGSTHVIHHFVVNQPFYLRQMVAPVAHAAMKKYGVRFNDIETFKRGNRYSSLN